MFDVALIDRELEEIRRAGVVARRIALTSTDDPLAHARMRAAVARNPHVAEQLGALAVGDLLADQAIGWALAAAWALRDDHPSRDLCLAQATALRAIQLRRHGDLEGAQRLLLVAERHGEVCGDLIATGMVAEARADISRTLHDLGTAWAASVRACACYRAAEAWRLAGRAYLTKAVVLTDMHEGREALLTLARAVAHLDRSQPRLIMVAVYTLALALAESDLFDQVDQLLNEASSAFEAATPQDRARVAWGVAAVCLKRDRPVQAESYYRQARQGFSETGAPTAFALVTLELCEKVLLPQGRTGEVRGMVEGSIPVLQRLGLSAGALRAWQLLQVAAGLDVTRLAAALRQPALRK